MAKKIFTKNSSADSSPYNMKISPIANIEDYIGTDRFGIYVHGTKGGFNDLPTEGCYHGDAWIINQHIIMWSATEEQWLDLGILAGVQGPEGPEGPQGVEGPEGKEGPMGAQGNDGYEGPQGPPGERGPQGPAGLGLYIMGTIDSEADLSGKCVSRPGQTWFLDGDAWVWTGDDFENIGKIQGPEGPKGQTGDKGERGEQGERGEKGADGQKGEQGPRGPQGIKGDSGEKGDIGDSVTLVVREVHKTEPGQMPEVNISNIDGKPPVQYIDFKIPQGEKGPIGPIGPPNHMEVGSVSTLPSNQPARVEITSETLYGIKLLSEDGTEWLLDVDNYGKIFTEVIDAQNDVPGSAISLVEIYGDDIYDEFGNATDGTVWQLYVNNDGKIILDDGEDEPEPPEPENPEPEEPEDVFLKFRNNKLIRVANKKNPIILIAPNKTVWRIGVTNDTNQLYTIDANNEIITSDSYVHQKISFFIPQGIEGVKGDRGPQGPINLIEAGSIETLEEHEDAQFEIEQFSTENALDEKPHVDDIYIENSEGDIYQIVIGDNERLTTVSMTDPLLRPPLELVYEYVILSHNSLLYKISIDNFGKLTSEEISEIEDGTTIREHLVLDNGQEINSYFKVRINEDGKLESEKINLVSKDDIVARVTQKLNLKIPRGKKGEKGETGRANRIQIVDVFTLPNEEPASAELSEPFLDRDPRFTIQDLILKLPRGEKGDRGWSIDYKWEDTVLFIKYENEEEWGEGVDLKGEKGDSTTFEGGIIKGDTTFDGRMDFVDSMYYKHEKMAGLTTLLSDSTAFGYKNLVAKNTLQVGYHRNDDYDCINPDHHGNSCYVEPEQEENKYDKYPATIHLHTMNGDSYIRKNMDNSLEFFGDGIVNFNVIDILHNNKQVANIPYVDSEIQKIKDFVGDFVEGVDGNIREYVDEQDNVVRSEMTSLINQSISNLDKVMRSEDAKVLQSSKAYTDTKDSAMKSYVDSQDLSVRNFATVEDSKVKAYANSEDEKYFKMSKDYVDARLEDLDITGSFVEYIMEEDEKYLQISKDYTDSKIGELDILGSVTEYIRKEDEKYLQMSIAHTDEVETNLISYINLEIANSSSQIYEYVNERDSYFANLTDGKILSVNNKIDKLKVDTETKIEESNLYFYNEILETNKVISQNYISLNSKIDNTKAEIKSYVDAEIDVLDIPTFKLDVANSFNAVDERNTIDEQNLHESNLFMVENFIAVNQMIEDLENKVHDFINIKDDNGIEWTIGIDTSGRIKTMKKSVALSSGFAKQKESPIIEKLIKQVISLENRIKQLEK